MDLKLPGALRRTWINLPLRGKGIAVVGLPIVAIAVGLATLFTMARRENQAQQWVQHTVVVRGRLGALLSNLLEAESNARGFVISHHEDFLPRLETAKAHAEKQIDELAALTHKNPVQAAQIPTLRKLVAEKFAAMEKMIVAERAAETLPASPQLLEAYRAMTPLRATIRRMDLEEERLQEIRTDQLHRTRGHAVAAGGATLALGFLGGLLAALLFGQSIARRMETLRMNARAMRLGATLPPTEGAFDEIGQVERELETTSQLLAERSEKLRQSEAELRAVIDNTTALIFVKDLESRFVLVNRQFRETFGVTPDSALGKAPEQFYRRQLAQEIRAHDLAVMESGRPDEFEEKIPIAGEIRTFLAVKVPLLDGKGRAYGICGIATDITQRQRATERLRESHSTLEEHVGQRTAALQQATRRLAEESSHHRQTADILEKTQAQLLHAQKMEVIGAVASGIAHDFNNILTAIMGYASLLMVGLPREEQREGHAAEILRAAERAAALSRQLLAFSRAQPYQPAVFRLEQVVRESESMLCRVLGDTITLRTEISSEVGAVKADPSQIEQLILNWIVNARDAMPHGGQIAIAARVVTEARNRPETIPDASRWVALSVIDEGEGIPPEVQSRMFDPFFTTKRPGQGTGLGLATCMSIAQRSGGWIDCESEVGKGTTFTLFLPRADEPVTPLRKKTTPKQVAGRETILVVEDEPAVGEVVALLLRDFGYQVLTAENGEAAERVIAAHAGEIDLVLTDLNMPRMNGRELMERLTMNNPGVRVILTSGNDDLLDERSAQSLEVEFLPKPFTGHGLAERVRQVLDKAPARVSVRN